MFTPPPVCIIPAGVTGTIINTAQNVANSGGTNTGLLSSEQNVIGAGASIGTTPNGMDAEGSGLLGGQDQCPTLNSGIACSGPDSANACMSSSELNCTTGDSNKGGTANSCGSPWGDCDGDSGGMGDWSSSDPTVGLPIDITNAIA